MKKIVKEKEPPLLRNYRTSAPQNTWEQFREGLSRRQKIKAALRSDQGGICAYCEIDLKARDSEGNADFRVEHFHPKSDRASSYNWALDWKNLLGCCHGGNQRNVVDADERFTSPDHSCDVPKDNKVLDDVILNPLMIPAFPCLFSIERTSGELKKNTTNCGIAGIDTQKVENTLLHLRLNANRLKKFRRRVLNTLNQEMMQQTSSGKTISEARTRLAKIHLRKSSDGDWPAFFSSIRAYLGKEAESHLRSIGYLG
ncbi:MAG: TIGR02646 family protein [Kistimonas sp.]|nr:TIGR02646 family protein [Kistimonas sp.]